MKKDSIVNPYDCFDRNEQWSFWANLYFIADSCKYSSNQHVCIILTDWIQNLHLFMNTYTHVDNVVCNTRIYISWNCIRMLCCQFQMLQHILTNYHNVGRYSETNTVSLVSVIFGRMVDSRGTHVLLWLLVFHSRSSSIQHSNHVKRECQLVYWVSSAVWCVLAPPAFNLYRWIAQQWVKRKQSASVFPGCLVGGKAKGKYPDRRLPCASMAGCSTRS